jgi:hypothetical protein
LSESLSCSTLTMDVRLVIDAEGKIPRAPIAGPRAFGDVDGLGCCSVSGLDAYAESVAALEALGFGDVTGLSGLGDRRLFAESASWDCCSRRRERASTRVACASLSSSYSAIESASSSTGLGFATGFRVT